METTIKVHKETKNRLENLDLSGKGKTFDMIVNDLITSYLNINIKNKKNIKEWKQSMEVHKQSMEDHKQRLKTYESEVKEHHKQKIIWEKLLKWSKSKGFKE